MSDSSEQFPRVLLLTPAEPCCPYGTGEVLRKTVRCLPEGSVYWASLKDGRAEQMDSVASFRAFSEKALHWRLKNTLFERLRLRGVARRRAHQVASWSASFRPQLLWVMACEEALNVGFFLQQTLNIPMHLTFHDAPEIESRWFGRYSRLASWLYVRRVAQLAGRATSIDAVSGELRDHVVALANCGDFCHTFVFPPSVSRNRAESMGGRTCYKDGSALRRIGFCGSIRISEQQWRGFVDLLGKMPFTFELIVFTDKDYFPKTSLPGNVSISMRGYARTEEELMRRLAESELHACYLGLWKEDGLGLFCRTSLSSKLATYAALGLPVIVDGPSDSVVWRIVHEHVAGILLSDDESKARLDLLTLFTDVAVWTRMAEDSERMHREMFDLDRNSKELMQILTETSRGFMDKGDTH
jgi:hypothetical protein